MKKSLLTFSLIGAAASLCAQITVNSTHIATVGDTVFLSEDTINGVNLNLGNAAGNQIWDFSSLVEHEPDGGILEDPSTAPLNANFPNATFVLNDLQEDSMHLFFERTSTALDIVGVVEYDSAGNPVIGDLTNPWRFMQFPATMGTTWSSAVINGVETDSFGVDFDGPGPHPFIDSLRNKFTFSFYNQIDAWGEVELPQGKFLSIRQKVQTTIKTSGDCYYDGAWNPYTAVMLAFLDSVSYDTADEATYRWWSDNSVANLFIVEIETDTNGDAGSVVSFTSQVPAWVQGVNKLTQTKFSVYPNPSTDFLRIETDYAGDWSYVLYDIKATPILKEYITGNSETINTLSIPSGVYLLQAIDENGQTIKLEKIQISH